MRTAVAALSLVVAGCLAQTPPSRAPLPLVGEVVEPTPPCSLMLGSGSGIEVTEVVPGSPSDGLLAAGDVLVGLDRASLASFSDLLAFLDEREPGDEVTFEVVRDDGDLEVDLTLGTPNAPSTRPSVGIVGNTRLEPSRLADVENGEATGPYVRLIDIDGRLYRFDPVGATLAPTGMATPSDAWESADGRVFTVAGGSMVDDTGRSVMPPEGFDLVGLLGAVDDDVILALQSPTDGAVSVARLDLDTDRVMWERGIDVSTGIPVGVLTAAVGELMVVATAAGDDPTTITGHELWNTADGSPVEVEVDVARVFGFFDEDTLVGLTSDGGLVRIDTATGEPAPLELAFTVATGMSVLPVGDGRYILVAGDGDLRRADLGEYAEQRTLAENCSIGAIGRPGAGI